MRIVELRKLMNLVYYRLDHMIDTKSKMNTSYGRKYINEWKSLSVSNFGKKNEQVMRKYILNSVKECLHFKPFIFEKNKYMK